MKTLALCLGLAALAAVPAAQAQVFRPETVRGAILGGIVGGVIGHNDGRRGWEGAAYGAAAGALVGSWVGESRERHLPPVPSYRPAYSRTFYEPLWFRHQAWAHDRHDHHAHRGYYRGPVRLYRDYRYERQTRWSDPAAQGLLIGGAVGAIIGHNQGRRGWEGAAYGAGAGWLLGALAERSRDRREEELRARVEAGWDTLRGTAPAHTQATVVHHHHYYGSTAPGAGAGANRLFGR